MNEDCLEKLIEAVSKLASLWDVTSKYFKDTKAKENAWKSVAEEVGEGVTEQECMRKWKNLRDTFVRELRKVKKKKSGEKGPKYVSRWPYFDNMLFMADTVKHRETFSNFEVIAPQELERNSPASGTVDDSFENSITQEQPPSLSSPTPLDDTCTPSTSRSISPVQQLKKRKRVDSAGGEGDKALLQSLKEIQESARERRAQKEDMDFNFALEVAGRLRRLSLRQNAFAKLQIQQLLFSVEFQETSNESPYQGNAYQF